MPRRDFTIVPVFIAAVAIGACQLEPPTGVLDREGFEAFATPRSFDGPGTVYRINSDGTRLHATTLTVRASGGGDEQVPKFTSTRELTADQLLESIGASAQALPATISAKLNSKRAASIEAVKASRATLSDDDIDPALAAWAATATPVDGSQYYLIRETISTKELTYKVSKSWLVDLGLDLEILEKAGYAGKAKPVGGDALELSAQFDQPMNVWYKTERVTFRRALGAGPNQYTIERQLVSAGTLRL